MANIKLFEEFVNEAKQLGNLYHFTTLISLLKIIDSDVLGDTTLGQHARVSLTRDKNLYKRTTIIPAECYIIIDGDKLSNRYKVVPYQWNAAHFSGKPAVKSGEIEDQMEEEVQSYIRNVSNYVKEIIIFEKELDYLPFDEDFAKEAAEILDRKPDEISGNDIIEWIKNQGYKITLR